MIPTGNSQPNIDRFLGFQEDYDRYRPQAPLIVPELLTSYLGDRPSLVADIGCGTGLSTFVWKNAADSAVGVEPNPDMLGKALDKLAQEADAASCLLYRATPISSPFPPAVSILSPARSRSTGWSL